MPATAVPLLSHTTTAIYASPTVTPTKAQVVVPTQTLISTHTLTPIPDPTVTPTETATLVPTRSSSGMNYGTANGGGLKIYFIQTKTGGKIGCGDSAVSVGTGITRSGDFAQDVRAALKRLFSYRDKFVFGLYNPLYLSNFAVLHAEFNPVNGVADIYLAGTYKPSGNDCDNLRVKAQVWLTVRQFPDIRFPNILLNGRPFGDQVSNDK